MNMCDACTFPIIALPFKYKGMMLCEECYVLKTVFAEEKATSIRDKERRGVNRDRVSDDIFVAGRDA